MPTIKILFDDSQVTSDEIDSLLSALKDMALQAQSLQNATFAFGYATSPSIKVGMEPIEVYFLISRELFKDTGDFAIEVKQFLTAWKQKQHFTHPINFTVMPMDWQIETGI